jgi:serine/threonine-protein kinase RsbW
VTAAPTTATLRLVIPAKPEYLVLGRLVLTGLSRSRPIDPDSLSDLKLALTEACSNSMRHAYRSANGSVEIVFEVGADEIAVEVLDQGSGFEPDAASGLATDGELDEGGLGLEIIKAVSDLTEVGARHDGSGARIRFVKRLS